MYLKGSFWFPERPPIKKSSVNYSKWEILLFEDHVPDRVAAGPLLQNDGGIPDSSGEGVARLRTQNGRQVMQHMLFLFVINRVADPDPYVFGPSGSYNI